MSQNAASKRVKIPYLTRKVLAARSLIKESGCLGLQPKVGGKIHLKLNICKRPIANKYREGKNFEKRVIIVLETAKGTSVRNCCCAQDLSFRRHCFGRFDPQGLWLEI